MRDEILAHLQRLGIPGYEAKAYLALLAGARPMNGYEVAKESSVPRSTVYETLTKLVRRGIAFEVPTEGQMQYAALPADALLSRLRRGFDDAIGDLERSLKEASRPSEASLIHHLRGEAAVMERARDVIAVATESLHVSAWPEHLRQLEPALREADDRAIDTWICAWGGSEIDVGKVYPNSLTTPESPLDRTDWLVRRLGCRLLVIVADRAVVLTAGTTAKEVWGVYTDDPAVVLLGYEAIVHYIVSDVLIDAMGPADFVRFWEADPMLMRLATGGVQEAGPVVERRGPR